MMPVPLCEITGDEAEAASGASCAACGRHIAPEDEVATGFDDWHCMACAEAAIARVAIEAKAYAEAHCRLTSPLPRYDFRAEFRPTRDEYAAGMREAYTPNAYRCHLRHNYTNYEQLIGGLDRVSAIDWVRYEAIRDRIEEIIGEALDEMEAEEDDLDPAA